MVRLMLVTVAAIGGVMVLAGEPGTRVAPAVEAAPVVADAAAAQPPRHSSDVGAELLQASLATPAAVASAIPGPRLQPSPQYAGRAATGESAAEPVAGALYVTAESVNVRSGPSTESSRVGRAFRGTALVPVGPATGAWVEVEDPAAGVRGFVSARFLSPNRNG